MFKQLKLKMIITYVISILIILLISFSLIFYLSYTSVHSEISNRLNSEYKKISPDKLNSNQEINILITDDQQLLYDNSNYDLTDRQYQMLVEDALDNQDKIIDYQGNKIAYRVYPESIKFINVTNDINYLNSLLYSLGWAFLIFSIIALAIGTILAKKAVKPVELAYYKQKDFVSDVSHEIRTPLSVIISNLQLYKHDSDPKLLDIAIDESNRITTLTETLLELSTVDFQKKQMTFEKIDLSNQINYAISAMEVKMYEEDFKLNINISDSIYINGQADRIKQLLIILLDNAIKYNDQQKIINISLKKKKDQAILIIENSSETLSSNQINNLFERFYRADESRNSQGFGLGLSLAKVITDQHHATIKCISIDQVTTFTIKFKIV